MALGEYKTVEGTRAMAGAAAAALAADADFEAVLSCWGRFHAKPTKSSLKQH
jgi:hypothetical protein